MSLIATSRDDWDPMSRPYVIPFFINHQGCPHRCSFCDQNLVSGQTVISGGLDRQAVGAGIRKGLERPRLAERKEIQVAFYGGSFTGLPRGRQEELLAGVQPFLASGEVHTVRISTRPDYISEESVAFLKTNGVKIVELGVQSMNDRVLAACGRGHTAGDSEKAIGIIRNSGLSVGVQLMVGLPGESPRSLFGGTEKLAGLKPDLARIYPLVVLKGSRLEKEMLDGSYRPLCLGKAVALSGRVREIFDMAGIKVVRTGLQETDGLQENIVAGPFHPAFGEMVLSRNLFRRVVNALSRLGGQRPARLRLSAVDQSVFRGQGNRNLRRLENRGLLDDVELVFDPELPRNSVFAG